MSTQPVIEVCGLHKRYGEHVAVQDVSFTVERGEVFGVLGPNGAGKTTTVECIEGLRRPDGGTVRVLGMDPVADARSLRQSVGAQLQESRLPDRLRVGEALDLHASFYADPADPGELMDLLGLTAKRRSPFAKLSGGQKQRLSIALALVGNPQVAVLDELTTGLDPQARRETWELVERVRDRGVTVLLVTHFMDEAERLCDRVAVIDGGRVVALDTPAGLVAGARTEQRVLFHPSETVPDDVLLAEEEVASVAREGRRVVVTGHGELLHAVTAALARRGVVAHDLRIEQTTLEDAFVALTTTSRTETVPTDQSSTEQEQAA